MSETILKLLFQCTVVPSCSRSEYENREDVYETINEHLDVNTTIDCLYYPIKIEVVSMKFVLIKHNFFRRAGLDLSVVTYL